MIGQTYLINGRRHKILKARSNDEKIEIVTDREWLTVDEKEMKNFLPAAPEMEINLQILPKHDNTLSDLRATILQAIEKIKTDKDYIPQAKAINSGIKTIINLGKLELDALKLINKLD